MDIIAGDIGGTKSWLVWSQSNDAELAVIRFERVYASASFPNADALLQQFIVDATENTQQIPSPSIFCLALPGPVDQGRATLTNLDWQLDSETLVAQFNVGQVVLINDFQASALGVETLHADDVLPLNYVDAEQQGVRVVTGAGTGLGLAWMQYAASTRSYGVYPTEGGHTDFAPANVQQQELLQFLRTEYAHDFTHVSWERLLSGSGITRLYHYCLSAAEPLTNVATTLPDAATINTQAQQGDALSQATLQLFADVYANWLGNVALLYQPKGGLYIAGGIATHIAPWLQSERFLTAYADKGRMQPLVGSVPLYLITNTGLGVQGALHRARCLLYDTGKN